MMQCCSYHFQPQGPPETTKELEFLAALKRTDTIEKEETFVKLTG